MKRSNSKNNKTKGPQIEKASKKSSAKAPVKKFPIVGIGASAGGLEAFAHLLEALPTDTGMGFVFIQHLDPTHKSLGPEILSRSTSMLVRQVEEGTRVHPNCVYLIPPNHNMMLTDGVLTLHPRTETRGKCVTIDSFFQSLAADQRERAIGLVLSGAASDGTQGLRAIKAVGGLCFAQDPKTAKHPDMPINAIAAKVVDLILPPAEIACELARISKHPFVAAVCEPKSEAHTESYAPIEVNKEDEDPSDAALRKIFAVLRFYSQIDFSKYKQATLLRRIERRMIVRRTETLGAYATYLLENNDEVKSLFNDILINVTSFFRDAESYKALAEQVFPQLIAKRESNSPIRIWVTACSTGEEAYSLAISLVEFLAESGTQFPIQIFATDISELCLKKARAGIYLESNLRDVSKERLKRFFDKVDEGYKIKKSIRQLCLFSRHDLDGDPAFGNLDLISCRNLLIYFAPILQRQVFPIFHQALNSGGFLWLGSSETTGTGNLFTLLDKTHKLYRKANVQTPMTLRFPLSPYVSEVHQSASPAPVHDKRTSDFERLADRIAVSEYAPPSVVVNYDMEILQFRGEMGSLLKIAPGPPSSNLLKMIRPELLHTLRMIIDDARTQNKPTSHEGSSYDSDGERRTVRIKVVPTNPHEPQNQRNFLIFFEALSPSSSAEKKNPAKRGTKVKPEKGGQSQQELRLAQLEQESSVNKVYQQSMFQYFKATREELAAGNEKLQSTNEELQRTNEELETTKEEVQSSNEELRTVNNELQKRNVELTQLTSYLDNVLVSADIPLVIVGSDHRIRSFTPQAMRIFSFIESDVGRPLSDIRTSFDLDLDVLVSEVTESLTALDREIQDREGHWMKLQVRPCKTIDNKIDGAVIALFDIDALKISLNTLQEREMRLNHVLEATEMGSWSFDLKTLKAWRSLRHDQIFGYPALLPEWTYNMFLEHVLEEDRNEVDDAFRGALISRTDWKFQWRIRRQDGAIRWIEVEGKPKSEAGQVVQFTGMVRDITDRKNIENNLAIESKNVRLFESITVAANEALSVDAALQVFLEKICKHARWSIGHAYLPAKDGSGKFIPSKVWYLDDQKKFARFKEGTELVELAPGAGLPGKVASTRTFASSNDLNHDFVPQKAKFAAEVGIRSSLCFPVFVGDVIVVVLEFLSTDSAKPDHDLIKIISHVTPQLSRVFERNRFNEVRDELLQSQLMVQKAIENERENFRNLFEQTPDMVCILSGPEHVFEFVNEAHVRALGFNATGMSVQTAHPETVETHSVLDEVYRSGKTAELFETPVTLAGRTRYFNGTYAARRDRSGQINGVMALAMEVTEQVLARKRIEEHAHELELSQKESTEILESMADGFIALDKNYTVLRVNRNQERISGLSRDKTVGKNHWEIWPPESIPQMWDTYEKVIRERIPVHFENFNPARNIWFTANVYPTPNGGLAAFFRDITPQKNSLLTIQSQRDRFSRLAAASGVGVWYCDLPFSDLVWDEKVKEHFWLPASAHVTIDTFYERIHPEDRKRTKKAIDDSINSHSRYDIEYRTISPNDESAIKWIRAIGWTDYSPSGTPIRFDGITLDITVATEQRDALTLLRKTDSPK